MRRANRPQSRTRRRGNSPDVSVRVPPPQPGDVVSSTFANMDLSVTRAAMADYARRCDALSLENEQLRAQLRDQASDSVKVVQHLESRLESTTALAAEQQQEMRRLLSNAADESAALRQSYDKLIEQRDEQVAQYAALSKRLQMELKSASQHVRQREEHRLELQRLHDSLEELAARHESELTALRFQTVDRKMRLVALEQTMRDSFRAQVETQSARLLEAKSHALLEDHSELQRERVRLTQDIDGLVQLTTTLNAESAEVRRNGVLHQNACQEALRRIVHGNRHVRESEMKTQRLEQRLKEVQEERRTLRETLTREYEARLQERDAAIAEMRQSIHTHRAELTRLRRIASTVVGQRTDLERFFYVALRDVRRMRASSGTSSLATTTHSMGDSRRYMNSSKNSGHMAKKHLMPASVSNHQKLLELMQLSQTQSLLQTPLQSRTLQFPLLGGMSSESLGNIPHAPPHSPLRSTGNVTFLTEPSTISLPADASVLHNELGVNLGKGDGAYLEDLSWEDKEKIIKALLYFINRTCYQRLPGAPSLSKLEEEEEEALCKLDGVASCKGTPDTVPSLKCKDSKR